MERLYPGVSSWVRGFCTVALVSVCFASCTSVPPAVPPGEPAATEPYPEHHRLYAGGINFFNKGDFPNSIRVLEQVWVRDPGYLEVSAYLSRAYLFAGLELYAEGYYQPAIDMWESVFAVYPGHEKAHRYITRATDEMRRLDAARK